MAINFPNSPALNDTHTAGGYSWTWDGSSWVASASAIPTLGTDTNGNYIQSITAGTGVTVFSGTGEGANASVSIGQAVGTTDSPTFAGLTLNGNLTVNGSTTVVNSTTMSVDDPIITLGGDTAPSSDDNKDRGVEFLWHDGTNAKRGFFGYDDSSGRFIFIPDATNTSEVFSGTYGTIQVMDVVLDTHSSTGTTGMVRATSPSISTPTLTLPIIDNPRVGYTTTTTAAGTTTLTSASNRQQYFTGTTTQTLQLPVASTMTLGQGFEVHNNSTGTLTVNSSGGNLVATIPAGLTALVTCILTSGTTAASWDLDFTGATSQTGSGSLVFSAGPTFTGTVILPATTQLVEQYLNVTASTTLTLATHQYQVIEANSASNITLTIPTNAAQAFPIGTTITIIRVGTGEVTLSPDTGVTLNNPLGNRLRVQWSTATIRKRATNTWLISGDLKV